MYCVFNYLILFGACSAGGMLELTRTKPSFSALT